MLEYLIPTLIIIALVLVNGLFVAAEFAIIGVRTTRLTQLVEAGNRIAVGIKRIRDDPLAQDRYIATAQIGITLASLGLGMYGEATVAHWLEVPLKQFFGLGIETAHAIAIVIALAIMTFAHVVVGEMIPKSLALQYAEQTALRIAGAMLFMSRLFSPAVYLLNAIGNALLRLFGIPPTAGQHRLYSPEELELVVAESTEGGYLSSQQERLIQNIFDFSDRSVAQVMTPRTRVSAVSITTTAEELPILLANARHSRLIVYDRNLDHVCGVVLIKDAIRRQLEQPNQPTLQELLRPMPIVPESARIGRVLAAFKRERVHIALVIDEYGGTAGVVTLEDLVEEVVGEVRDEFDGSDIPKLRQIAPNIVQVRGDLLLDEVREAVEIDFPEEIAQHVETLGGLIMTILGRTATVGDTLQLGNIQLVVETVEGQAIQLVRIIQPPQPTPNTLPHGKH